MKNSNTITFFNAENKTINDIINISNNDLYIIYDNEKYFLTHKKSGSAILIISDNKNVGDILINNLSAHIYEDIRILRYLFKYHNILFYDEAFETYVELLDRVKDKKYWENERNLYAVELMMHHGVIRDIPELEKILNVKYKSFVDTTIIEKSQLIQYKRLKTLLYKTKIKLFFKKIKMLFKRLKK
jgi:hypothetical protein